MCTDRDPPPCEHAALIAEVDRLQGHNASLALTVTELRRQLAAAQTSGVESLAWGTSAVVSCPLQMSCRGRQWMCRWTTTTVPDVEGCSSRKGWMLPT